MSPADSRRDRWRFCPPAHRWGSFAPSRRASQVPRPICRRLPSSTTPGSRVAASHSFAARVGFTVSGWLATPKCAFEAESGSLALRLTSSPSRVLDPRRLPSDGPRVATCVVGHLHGRLLSSCKIGQACPGVPECGERKAASGQRNAASGQRNADRGQQPANPCQRLVFRYSLRMPD